MVEGTRLMGVIFQIDLIRRAREDAGRDQPVPGSRSALKNSAALLNVKPSRRA